MNKIVKIAAAASAVVLMTACAGCGTGGAPSEASSQASESSRVEETTKTEPTTQKDTRCTLPTYVTPTAKPTDPPPTVKPTEPLPSTMEELLTMSVPEILELLDYDITVESNAEHSYYGGSTGSICFYNFDRLPGFVFSPNGVLYNPVGTDLDKIKADILANTYPKLSFVVAIDGAKMNDSISSAITYNEISAVTGNYATNPPAGQGLITQNLSAFCPNARLVSVTYETSREAFNHVDKKTGYDVEFLKQENPKVSYIIAYLGG